MTLNSGGRRLKQWLVEQINSNQYSGLQWEDDPHRTMFRIPWKHAGKQDYNQEVDASIFKVSSTKLSDNCDLKVARRFLPLA